MNERTGKVDYWIILFVFSLTLNGITLGMLLFVQLEKHQIIASILIIISTAISAVLMFRKSVEMRRKS